MEEVRRFVLHIRAAPRPPAVEFALVLGTPGPARQTAHLSFGPSTTLARQTADLIFYGEEQTMSTRPARQTAHLLFSSAHEARQVAHCWFSAAREARQTAHLRWAAAVETRQTAHLAFSCLSTTRQTAHLRFFGGAQGVRQTAHLLFTAAESVPARQTAHLLFRAVPESTGTLPQTRCTINGVAVQPLAVSVSSDSKQVVDTANLDFAEPLPAAILREGLPVVLTLWGTEWHLVVESWTSSRAFASRSWTVQAASPALLLQGRFASPVDGPLSGRAAELARQLAGDLPLRWQIVDWMIPPGVWQAENAAPLELLRNLVSAAGGILTSNPDGSLSALPWPPAAPADWPALSTAQVDSLSALVSISDSADPRDLFDSVTVADGEQAEGQFRIEEDREKRHGDTTEVLVYQIPWGDADISHRGDPALIVLADLGVEERIVQDEQIVINGGAGSTQYPIYSVTANRWNAVNLGRITFAEDGTVETALDGESILYLSYRTRARRYRVSLGPALELLLVEGSYGSQ